MAYPLPQSTMAPPSKSAMISGAIRAVCMRQLSQIGPFQRARAAAPDWHVPCIIDFVQSKRCHAKNSNPLSSWLWESWKIFSRNHWYLSKKPNLP